MITIVLEVEELPKYQLALISILKQVVTKSSEELENLSDDLYYSLDLLEKVTEASNQETIKAQ